MKAKKILVPVSLAEGSRASLAVAAALAQDLEATIVLLHVVLDEASEDRGRAEKALHQLAAKTPPPTPVECIICAGIPAQKIIDKQDEFRTDTIVLSTHGHCGWFNWLHRQTARSVLRQASCPVWVIFPGAAGKIPTLSLFPGRRTRENFPWTDRSANLFPFPASSPILMPPG